MTTTWLHARFIDKSISRQGVIDIIRKYASNSSDLTDLIEKIDSFVEEFIGDIKKKLDLPKAGLFIDFPKTHPDSITWEAINIIQLSATNSLTVSDLPFILDFLSTPTGEEESAWANWDKYWGQLRRSNADQ